MEIFNGKKEAEKLDIVIRQKVNAFGKRPSLGIIWIGDNGSSEKYINVKKRVGESLGIDCQVFHFEKYTTEIDDIFSKNMDGYIVQLPLPENCPKNLLDLIPCNKDPDLLTSINTDRYYSGNFEKLSPVVLATQHFLDLYKINLKNKKICILGQGSLTGKPLSYFLQKNGAVVTVFDKHFSADNYKFFASKEIRTRETVFTGEFLDFDIVIPCLGVPNILKGSSVADGSIVIDFGSGVLDGRLVGDFDLSSDFTHLSILSPSPGGMGLLVTRFLFLNLI